MNKLFACLSLFAIVACNEIDRDYSVNVDNSVKSSVYRISEKEALEFLKIAYPGLSSETKSHDYDRLEIKEIFPVVNDIRTKSSGDVSDTLLYVVNFKDDNGFAILSADRRIPTEVLMTGSDGNISGWGNTGDISDTLQYGGMIGGDGNDFDPYEDFYDEEEDEYCVGGEPNPSQVLLDLVKDYAAYRMTLSDLNTENDHFIKDPNGDMDGDWFYPVDVTCDTILMIPSMIKGLWHQSPPFNNECPGKIFASGNVPAGCVPIAIASIMTYNAYPTNFSYNGIKMDWEQMSSKTNIWNDGSEVSRMVAALVSAIRVKTNAIYTNDWTFVWPKNAASALKSWGYDNVKRIKYYNEDIIIESLKEDKPVFIAGTDKDPFNGHAWVIDGYSRIYKRYRMKSGVTGEISEPKSTISNMLHCKTGWGTIREVVVFSDIFVLSSDYKTDRNYRIITYDVPNK